MNLRLVSARVIQQVLAGQSLTEALTTLPTLTNPRDRAFIQATTYGVCRFYPRLDLVLQELLEKPLKAKDSDIYALLLVGLFQLMNMEVADYAAVTETVNATQEMQKPWAKGLVNAILRTYLRKQELLQKFIEKNPIALYAHPAWWIKAIQTAWPAESHSILLANNEHPPFAVRVNKKHLSRETYLEVLKEKGFSAKPIQHTAQGLILAEAISITDLPGFLQGDVSVQDGAAQLTADLLELQPNLTVLDACSAPGGKLTHILEIEPNLKTCVAIEKDTSRLERIFDNLERLQLSAKCLCADAALPNTWWDGQLFDRILLDVPCSASGVIRRHPDIKLLRQPEDIVSLSVQQKALLQALWPLLKVGGLLVYVTCSIFPEENAQILENFLASEKNVREEKLAVDWGVACTIGRQILPGMSDMDGFYFAKLRKI